MSKNRLLIIIYCLILVLCISIGIFTRKSFYGNTSLPMSNNLDNLTLCVSSSDTSNIYFDNNIKDYDDLKQKSDIIVKVRLSGERKSLSGTILSKVEILSVYKGTDVKKSDIIYIYEPCFFINNTYNSVDGYNMMVENNDYVVFLKHLKIPEGYKYKGVEQISFMPVSTKYAKYNLSNYENKAFEKNELDSTLLNYKIIKNNDIITSQKADIDKYTSIKNNLKDFN
ncbi:hypothetical protein [Clostridium sp.]|uniref:hypothetical protein n=1 Tax=Clostridium sp. TaxID=1506 RepID=UPI0028497C21|nr:hypothetical protein [Clostridium sp.]MDR3595878.1 hypothetical protein [Clostridium sp.]